jgi:hypothetical protein
MTRLVVAALACSTLAIPAGAAPQWPGDRRGVERQRGSAEAYQRGYNEGVRNGRDDGRRRRSFNVQSHPEYRSADAGYDRNDGRRGSYQDEFRRGFTEGYRVGYGRDGRVNPAGSRDPGRARGYSDGFRHGMEDRNRNRRFDPEGERDYRNADQGYSGVYGSRERY